MKMSERQNLKTLYCKLIPIVENEVNILGTLMTGDSLHVKRFSDECVRLTLLRDDSDKVKNIVFYEGGIKQLPVNDSEYDGGIASTSMQTADITSETDEPVHSVNITDIVTPKENIKVSSNNPLSSKYDLDGTNCQSFEDGNSPSLYDNLVITDKKKPHSLVGGDPLTLQENLIIIDKTNHHSLVGSNGSSSKDDLVINHHSLDDDNPSTSKENLVIIDKTNNYSFVGSNPSSSKDELVIIDGTNNLSSDDANPSTLKDDLGILERRNRYFSEGNKSVPNELSQIRFISDDHTYTKSETKKDNPHDEFASDESDSDEEPLHFMEIVNGTNKSSLDRSSSSINYVVNTLINNCIQILALDGLNDLETNGDSGQNLNMGVGTGEHFNCSVGSNEISSVNSETELNPSDGVARKHSFTDEINQTGGIDPEQNSPVRMTANLNPKFAFAVNQNSTADIYQTDGNDAELNLSDGTASEIIPTIEVTSHPDVRTAVYQNLTAGIHPADGTVIKQNSSNETVVELNSYDETNNVKNAAKLNIENADKPNTADVIAANFDLKTKAAPKLNPTDATGDVNNDIKQKISARIVGKLNPIVKTSSNSNVELNLSVDTNQNTEALPKMNQTDKTKDVKNATRNKPNVGNAEEWNPLLGTIAKSNPGEELNLSAVNFNINIEAVPKFKLPGGIADVTHATKQNIKTQSVKKLNLIGSVVKPSWNDEIDAELNPSHGAALEHNLSDRTAPENNSYVGNTVNPDNITEAIPKQNPLERNFYAKKAVKNKINLGTTEKQNRIVGIIEKLNSDVKSTAEYKPSHESAADKNPSEGTPDKIQTDENAGVTSNLSKGNGNVVNLNLIPKAAAETSVVAEKICIDVRIPEHKNLKAKPAAKRNLVVETSENTSNLNAVNSAHINLDIKIPEIHHSCPKKIEGLNSGHIASFFNPKPKIASSKSEAALDPTFKPDANIDLNQQSGIAKTLTCNYGGYPSSILVSGTSLELNSDSATSKNLNIALGISEGDTNSNLNLEISEKPRLVSESYVQLNPNIRTPGIAERSHLNEGVDVKPNLNIEIADKEVVVEIAVQLNSTVGTAENLIHFPRFAETSSLNDMGVENSNLVINSKPNLDSRINIKPCLIAEKTIHLNPSVGVAAPLSLDLGSNFNPPLNSGIAAQLNSTIETAGNTTQNLYLNEGVDANLNPNNRIASYKNLKGAVTDLNLNSRIAVQSNLDSGIESKSSLIAGTTLQMNPSVRIAENQSLNSHAIPITNLNIEMPVNLNCNSKSTNNLVIIETPKHPNPNLESIPLLQLFQNVGSTKNQLVASENEIKSPFENEMMKRKPSLKTYETKNKLLKISPLKVPNWSEIVKSISSKKIDYSVDKYCNSQQIDTGNYWTIEPLYQSIGYFDTNNHLEFEDHLNKVMFNSFKRLIPSDKETIPSKIESENSKIESINSTIESNVNNIEIVHLSSELTTSNNINYNFNNNLMNNDHLIIMDEADVEEGKIETVNPKQLADSISNENENIISDDKKEFNINVIDVNMCLNVNNDGNNLITSESSCTEVNVFNETCHMVSKFKPCSNINVQNQIPINTSCDTNEIVPNFKQFSNLTIQNKIPINTSSDTNKIVPNFKQFSNLTIQNLIPTNTSSGTNEIVPNFKQFSNKNIKNEIASNFKDLTEPRKLIKSIIKRQRNLIKKRVRFNLSEEKLEFSIDSTKENSKCNIDSIKEEKPTKGINTKEPKNVSTLGNKSYSRNVYGSKRKTNLKNINQSFLNSRNVSKTSICNDNHSVESKNESFRSKTELISSKNMVSRNGLFSLRHELTSSRIQSISSRNESISARNESFNSQNQLFNSGQELISSGSGSISSKNELIGARNECIVSRNELIESKNKSSSSRIESLKDKSDHVSPTISNGTGISNVEGSKTQLIKVPPTKSYQKVNRKMVGKETLVKNKDAKEVSLNGNKDITEISLLKTNEGKIETSLIMNIKDTNELSVSKGNKDITEISLIGEDGGKDETSIPKEVVDKKEILLLIKKKKDMNKVPDAKEKEVEEDYLVETMVISEGKESINELKVVESDKNVTSDSSSVVIKNYDCRNEISVIKGGSDKNETWVMKEYKIINDSLVQEDNDDSKKKSVKKSKLNTEVFSIYNDAENPDLIIIETMNENAPIKVTERSEKPSPETTVDLDKPVLNCHYCKFKTKYKTSITRHLASKHFDEMGLKVKKTYSYKKKYKIINGNKLKLKIVNVPKKRGRKKLKNNQKIESENDKKKEISRKRKMVENGVKNSTQTVRKQPKMESWQVESIVSGLCQNIINKESVETTQIGSNNVKIGFRSKRKDNSGVNLSNNHLDVSHLPKRVIVKRTEEEIEKYKIRCIRCNDDNVYTENQLRLHLLEKHEKNTSSSIKLVCSLCFTAFDDLVGHMKLNHPDTTFNINPCCLFG